MKIPITDDGSGITAKFARAIGAKIDGRFIYIPESKGGGYLTGFSWGSDLRMMIRNYHLNEDMVIERTNELAEGQEDVVFLLSGIFPSTLSSGTALQVEKANILICRHAVSSIIDMPSETMFCSVTIAVSKSYLQKLFGHIDHPVAASVLEAGETLLFETGISTAIMNAAGEMLQQPVPEHLERQYYRLKCEELLCLTFALLTEREPVPVSVLHIADIRAIYAIRLRLQSQREAAPDIAALAAAAHMSAPKLRKLFKQTFGKGVFEYYQSARMQEAARLLREERLTVSEAGYRIGFTNLSHFSRVFEQHFGMKPKKYSAT